APPTLPGTFPPRLPPLLPARFPPLCPCILPACFRLRFRGMIRRISSRFCIPSVPIPDSFQVLPAAVPWPFQNFSGAPLQRIHDVSHFFSRHGIVSGGSEGKNRSQAGGMINPCRSALRGSAASWISRRHVSSDSTESVGRLTQPRESLP